MIICLIGCILVQKIEELRRIRKMRHIKREKQMESNSSGSSKQKADNIVRPAVGTEDIQSKCIKAHRLSLSDIDSSLG